MVGSLFVAVAALVVLEYWGQNWRIFAVACAIPSAVGALMVWTLVPESPRFLAIRHRQDEALRGCNMLAMSMKISGELYTSTEMLTFYPEEESRDDSPLAHIHTTNTYVWLCAVVFAGFKDFVQSTSKIYNPRLLPTTWPLQTIWFSLNFGSYGILTWINTIFVAVHLENVYFNAFLFAGANLPGNLLSGFLMDRTGRTSMLASTSMAAAVSLLMFAYFAAGSESSVNATGVVLSACSFQAFTIAAWNTIDCMTSERFPTSVRSTGMGVCAASGRIGAMIAQMVNGALVGSPVRLLLVASTSLVIAAITPFLLPTGDYANRALEDDLEPNKSTHNEETIRLNDAAEAQPYIRVSGYQTVGSDEKNIV